MVLCCVRIANSGTVAASSVFACEVIRHASPGSHSGVPSQCDQSFPQRQSTSMFHEGNEITSHVRFYLAGGRVRHRATETDGHIGYRVDQRQAGDDLQRGVTQVYTSDQDHADHTWVCPQHLKQKTLCNHNLLTHGNAANAVLLA